MSTAYRLGCALAVVIALSACSESPTGEDPSETAAGPAPSSSTPGGPGHTPPVDDPSPAGGDGLQLDAGELLAVLAAVDEAESLNAQLIPDAELRALAQEGAQQASDITVTPEECNAYSESSPESLPNEAGRAAMTFAGESSLQPDTVSLSSLLSAEDARAQVQSSRDQLGSCSRFTMDIAGQSIETTVAEVNVSTAADEDLALRTTAQVPGTIQESVTVRAVVGSTVVDVLVGGSTDPEADVERAEQLTDLIVAQLRLL